jgi:hypothetical protein
VPGPARGSPAARRTPASSRSEADSGSGSGSFSGSGSDTDSDDLRRDALRNSAAAAAVGAPQRKRGAAPARKLPRLASFSDLPEYLRDNEFIVDFYRPTSTPWDSLRTLWRLHNETGNVWTHLLGASARAAA